MNGHDRMLEDVAAYALGVLPADEASEVQAHLAGCPECRAEYEFMAPAVTAIAYSAEATAAELPGAQLKARIMQSVRPVRLARRSFAAWPGYLAAAACICIAVGLALQNSSLRRDIVAMQARSGAQQAALARDQAATDNQRRMIADLTAGDARRYPFVHGMVVTRGSHVYVAMHAGKALPSGRVYQAWTLAKGSKTIRPSITFSVPERSMAMVEIPAAAQSLSVVAVSVEPAGGSLQPTTKPIAVIKLNG